MVQQIGSPPGGAGGVGVFGGIYLANEQQNINVSTPTLVLLDTAHALDEGMAEVGNNGIRIASAGWYLIQFGILWDCGEMADDKCTNGAPFVRQYNGYVDLDDGGNSITTNLHPGIMTNTTVANGQLRCCFFARLGADKLLKLYCYTSDPDNTVDLLAGVRETYLEVMRMRD